MSDLINRQAAIDAMADAIWHYPNEKYAELNDYENARRLADYGLSRLPSAQPTVDPVKCGEWLPMPKNHPSNNSWYCSECGNGVEIKDHFCSNCGAKMDERKEE